MRLNIDHLHAVIIDAELIYILPYCVLCFSKKGGKDLK